MVALEREVEHGVGAPVVIECDDVRHVALLEVVDLGTRGARHHDGHEIVVGPRWPEGATDGRVRETLLYVAID